MGRPLSEGVRTQPDHGETAPVPSVMFPQGRVDVVGRGAVLMRGIYPAETPTGMADRWRFGHSSPLGCPSGPGPLGPCRQRTR